MLESAVRDDLVALFKAYARREKTTLAAASYRMYGNPEWFDGFRKGERSISLRMVDRLIKDLSAVWPEGKPWPAKFLSRVE